MSKKRMLAFEKAADGRFVGRIEHRPARAAAPRYFEAQSKSGKGFAGRAARKSSVPALPS